ncbi:MAG TPA: phytanoyl-CoA dioxygenase family protein [Kofleriaceae bacterium]|nr:phytanoyl-CoA dioxygenase family protein [Kofleriaceae bacterium]
MHAHVIRDEHSDLVAGYRGHHGEFRDNGCVFVKQLLTAAEVDELRAQLQRFIRDVAPTLDDGSVIRTPGGALRALENLPVDPFFHAYASSPRWMALASALLGGPVLPAVPDELSGSFGGQVYIDMPPGAGTSTPPHQDARYHNLIPPESVNIWLALDQTDASNGGMRYVRGSHRRGMRSHATDGQQPGFSMAISDFGPGDLDGEIAFSLEPGDAVAHHGLTIHRAPENRSARHRRAFCMFMRRADCRRDEAGHARYMAILDAHVAHFHLKPGAR